MILKNKILTADKFDESTDDVYLFPSSSRSPKGGCKFSMGKGLGLEVIERYPGIDNKFNMNLFNGHIPCYYHLTYVNPYVLKSTITIGAFQNRIKSSDKPSYNMIEVSADVLNKDSREVPNRIFHLGNLGIGNICDGYGDCQIDDRLLTILQALPDNVFYYTGN
jgi:hypothetical protein